MNDSRQMHARLLYVYFMTCPFIFQTKNKFCLKKHHSVNDRFMNYISNLSSLMRSS